MTADTVFDLASLTKPIVGAGVAMALVDEGQVSLDEEVTTWLPELDEFRGKGVTRAPAARPHRRGHRLAAGVHRR